MNKQECEISELELTTEEMDQVSGGVKNKDLPEFKAFEAAYLRAYMLNR